MRLCIIVAVMTKPFPLEVVEIPFSRQTNPNNAPVDPTK